MNRIAALSVAWAFVAGCRANSVVPTAPDLAVADLATVDQATDLAVPPNDLAQIGESCSLLGQWYSQQGSPLSNSHVTFSSDGSISIMQGLELFGSGSWTLKSDELTLQMRDHVDAGQLDAVSYTLDFSDGCAKFQAQLSSATSGIYVSLLTDIWYFRVVTD